MELKQYLSIVWKWMWLILLAAAVAAVSSYFASRSATKVYRTSTTLMVGQSMEEANPDSNALVMSRLLLATYVDLAKREPVLQGAVDALKLPVSWDTLLGQVSVVPIEGTNLVQIVVVDTNTLRVKALADEIAHQLILQSPTPNDAQDEQRRQFVQSRLEELERKINQTSKEIEDLDAAMIAEVSARRIQEIQMTIAASEVQLNNWESTYANLLTFVKGGSNYLRVVEPARVPKAPINASARQNAILAAFIGALLALFATFLLEYLDDTVKVPEDVLRVMGSSVLGMIARINPVNKPTDALVTAEYPKSSLAEAYRVVRTNIQFAALRNPTASLLVTSAGPQEGKSTTLANLGVVMAQAGKRTLLVDSDLRRPSLHKVFGLPNRQGLSTLLLAEQPDIAGTVQATGVPKLSVLTSGIIPPNPAELLATKQMDALVDLLTKQYDAVIYDSPPILAVADTSILAAKIREVVMVVDAGRTRTDVAQRAKRDVDNTGAKLLGVVLNRLTQRRAGYGYYYYYSSDDGQRRRGRSEKGLAALLHRARRRLLGRGSGHSRQQSGQGPADASAATASDTSSR